MSNNNALLRIQKLYAALPTIECKGLCHSSCSTGIQLSTTEMHQIRKRKGFEFKGTPIGQRCPLLDVITKRCTVYDIRPMVCRLWGLTERMRCQHGCVPDRTLTDREELELINEAMYLGGSYTEEEYRQNIEWMDDPGIYAAMCDYMRSNDRRVDREKLARAVAERRGQ